MATIDEGGARTSTPRTRRRSLDGIRAVAACGVVLYHCQYAVGFPSRRTEIGALIGGLGHTGVAVFFVLSGFLLFREFVGWILFERPHTPLPHYFERRFLRIYPAYWLALIGLVVVEGRSALKGDAFGIFTLLGRSFDSTNVFLGLGVAWSLMIEVLFYLVLPVLSFAIAAVAHRLDDPRARLAVVMGAMAAMAIGAHLWLAFVVGAHPDDPALRFNLPTYCGWFAAGMVLSTLSVWRSSGRGLPDAFTGLAERTWACWLLAAIAYFAISIQGAALARVVGDALHTEGHVQWQLFLQAITAFLFVLPVVMGREGGTTDRILGNRVIAWIGLVSYGVYLWHTTLLAYLHRHVRVDASWIGLAEMTAMVLVASIAIAAVSHYVVELPALRLAR